MPTFARNLAQEKPAQAASPTEGPDTANRFHVHVLGEQITVMGNGLLRHPISREQALNLAAHLVAAADPQDETGIFDWTLEEILR